MKSDQHHIISYRVQGTGETLRLDVGMSRCLYSLTLHSTMYSICAAIVLQRFHLVSRVGHRQSHRHFSG